MLVGVGGRERTEAEFAALLGSAGFRAMRYVQTALDFSEIEGVTA